MALRLRRGTDAERLSITPLEGELIYTTDTKELYMGDGTTVGGNLVSGELIDDASPTLSGNLDLNGNDIVGNGNISINGTITATGNINLGDGAEDNVIVGGQIGSSLIPKDDVSYDLGAAGSYWRNIYTNGLTVDGVLSASAMNADVIGDDSSVLVNTATNTFSGDLVGNVTGNLTGNTTGYHTGDMTGSVFANDSTLLVDGINGNITANSITASGNLTANRIVFGELALLDDPGASQVIIESVIPGTDGAAALLLNSYNSGSGFPTNRATLQLQSTHTDEDYENWDTWINGRIVFSRDDQNGQAAPAVITSRTSRLELKVHNRFGVDDFPESHGVYISTTTGYTGIGVYEAEAQLHNPGDSKLGDLLISQNNISTVDSNANIRLAPNGTGTVELSVPTQSTVGAAGGAAAIPATPDIYFKVNINGTEYVVPGFAVS